MTAFMKTRNDQNKKYVQETYSFNAKMMRRGHISYQGAVCNFCSFVFYLRIVGS